MDKEKLFAARKKLKEYQLCKKDNTHKQEVTENLKDKFIKDNITVKEKYNTTCNNVNFETENSDKVSRLHEGEIKSTEPIQLISTFVNDNQEECSINFMNKTNNFSSPEDYINRTNNDVHHLQRDEFRVLENNDLSKKINDQSNVETFTECTDANIINSSADSPLKDTNVLNKNFTENLYNDSSFLQKEHLLQMASSVQQILGDVTDFSEAQTVSNLIDKNQFLTNCLQEQTKLVNELHVQVSQHTNKVSELEALLAAKDAECETKIIQEINLLKEQVQLHTHTTGILVAEKAELSSTIDQCYATIRQKTELTEELNKKLKSFQLQVIEFEKESTHLKNSNQEMNLAYQLLQQNYTKLMDDFSNLRKEKESMELECSELKQKLSLNNTKLVNFQQELQEKNAMLSLNEIKIQQLINSSDQFKSLENEHQTSLVFEQQLTQMKDALTSINNEKDEANKQYKIYLEQSDERIKKLDKELQESHRHVEELQLREKSYVQRLLEMEQQLQVEREQTESLRPLLEDKNKIEILTRNIDNLVMEQESLQLALNHKDAEIEMLNKELRELPEIKEHSLDASALVTALESEQLGASRAVSQNQQLKNQLEEMHNAFVLLSNNKLDLTEQLQTERNMCKQLNSRLTECEVQINGLKNQLKEKEVSFSEVEKEKASNTDFTCDSSENKIHSHESNILLQDYQNAQILIDNLQKENQVLRKELSSQSNQIEVKKYAMISATDDIEINNIEPQPSETIKPDMPESIKKLERRFKETMNKVAELTDEKQRLEHLVLQLQEETETIGEYVSLYQKQRSILQEKANEREQTFREISDQRNHQQEQLNKLKVLVAKLLKLKSSDLKRIVEAIEISSSTCSNTKENSKDLDQGSNSEENIDTKETDTKPNLKDEAASQLLDLLTEIKDCSGMCIMEPNFHPCPLCSGKLITI